MSYRKRYYIINLKNHILYMKHTNIIKYVYFLFNLFLLFLFISKNSPNSKS